MSKIYIMPTSPGKYEGKLLVFDHVESMTHIKASKIPNHPVESFNRSSADHRYREGTKITIVANVSNEWTTLATVQPQPLFQTQARLRNKLLRTGARNELGASSKTTKLVNKILDKEPYTTDEVLAVPNDESFFVREAIRLLAVEKDSLSISSEKELFLESQASNEDTIGGQVNTIAQAHEMLTYLDETSSIVTVYSLYETFEDMVISNFSNPLRNGAERGAYWVSLTLDQQLIATTVKNPLNISSRSSEEVHDTKDGGKQTPNTVKVGDPEYNIALKIWEDELAKQPELKQYISERFKENAVLEAAQNYQKVGAQDFGARENVRATLIQVKNQKSKLRGN